MNEVKELVDELRNKKSRDNRDLFDRSADMIEKLAKELCDKSGCHHKCNDTKDYAVGGEARQHLPSALTNEEKVSAKDKLLLINENQSNNFGVKSNNELFKQALVEGLNRRIDKTIEEEKQIEQIEEIADKLYYNTPILEEETCNIVAEYLYNTGWVQLPCKVGDTLYVISQMKDKRILPFINKYEVTSICIKKKSIIIYHEMDGYIKIFGEIDFGKTVFLSKEEAEKALAKMKGGERE